MNCKKCSNTKCFIQKYCHNNWLDYSEYHKTAKQISSGKKIFSEGDLVTGMYIICSGKVKVLLHDSKKKEKIIRVSGAGQILGHRGFNDKMTYPISAKTIIDSELAFIPNEDFFHLVRANKDLSFAMMIFFADELMRSEQKQRAVVLKSSIEKVANATIMVVDAFGFTNNKKKTIDLGLSLHELADYAGISFPNLKVALKTLIERDILQECDKEFNLTDEKTLRSLAGMEF